MTTMKDAQALAIERVNNGWIIRNPDHLSRLGSGAMLTPVAVAETPAKLVALVGEWAAQQEAAQAEAPAPAA